MVEEIEVFVRKPGESPTIKITKDWVQAPQASVIVWNIHRMSRNVEWIGIQFDNSDAQYFMNGNTLTHETVAHFHNDHAHILGVSPGLVKQNPNYTMREDKYTIKCWKQKPANPSDPEENGYKLDPVIVTCDP